MLAGVVTAILLLRDVRRNRVVTPSEVAFFTGFPVIATTTWPRALHALDDLVHDLDDRAVEAEGTTIIVAFGERERAAAYTLAECLDQHWSNLAAEESERRARDDEPSSSWALRGAPPDSLEAMDDPGVEELGSTFRRRHRSGYEFARRIVFWDGHTGSPKLRRESRLASRVLVVVASRANRGHELASLRTSLDRDRGVGIVVVDLPYAIERGEDRVGPIDDFWNAAVTG